MNSPSDIESQKYALIAAADGYPDEVRALLAAGVDPNGMPLIMAIQCNEVEIVKMMVAAGADVDFDFADTTPLIRAVSSTHPEVVRALIEAGANVNKRATDGSTPLQAALQTGRLNATEQERSTIIKLLKDAGATE